MSDRRIRLARRLLRLGSFVESLPVAVMKPDDLIRFSRNAYENPESIDGWSEESLVDSGLTDDERELIESLPQATGDLLLLGVGGGREAIPFARMGFNVTGVDYIAESVERSKENAAARGLTVDGLVQEISELDVGEGSYDVVWLSRFMYSCVPTRARRVDMGRRIERAIKPEGYFLCQFQWGPDRLFGRGEAARRTFARFSGNASYEAGDSLWANIEFVHQFTSEGEIRSELEEAGFSVLRIGSAVQHTRGSAVCRKGPGRSAPTVPGEEAR